jgi:hypothetical protein
MEPVDMGGQASLLINYSADSAASKRTKGLSAQRAVVCISIASFGISRRQKHKSKILSVPRALAAAANRVGHINEEKN